MSNKKQLPVEVVQEIKEAAKVYTHTEVKGMVDGSDINPGHRFFTPYKKDCCYK